ncbi:MAG: diacylglycerol kinase [Planctomycetaceae bacterium]|nr:diacylglycerol kinase [Planctomycetaceae bacterium]
MSAPTPFQPPPRTWLNKFRDAFVGVYLGVAGQSSFLVHGLAFLAVLVLGVVLHIAAWEWAAVLIVSGLVFTLELVNSALENLARSITVNHDLHIDRALKIASAAVLAAAGVAILIGLIIFGPPLWQLVS